MLDDRPITEVLNSREDRSMHGFDGMNYRMRKWTMKDKENHIQIHRMYGLWKEAQTIRLDKKCDQERIDNW
jgi:hypothetical protein